MRTLKLLSMMLSMMLLPGCFSWSLAPAPKPAEIDIPAPQYLSPETIQSIASGGAKLKSSEQLDLTERTALRELIRACRADRKNLAGLPELLRSD